VEFRVQLQGGKIRYMMSNALVLRDGAGQAVRLIGINRDRTDREEAERERQRLQAELHQAEKMESVGSLAGGVAHDMNNVLAAILASAERLRQSFPDGDPVAGSLDNILHAGGRGRDLVQALTAFARKGMQETCTIDLNEILNREVELLRHTTLQRVEMVLALDPALPRVNGNASALGSAIMNLAINALDAMPAGGTLTLSSRVLEDGMVGVEVADSGQGMAPEVLAKAVEPYFTTKPIGKGTGLGLSRVYGTVKAHGGFLELHSNLGQGTSAVLHLPPVVPGTEGSDTIPGSAEVQVTSRPPMDILLVDDDNLILETVAPLITSLGHRVRTAASGEEALSALDTGPDPGLVILDHHMPGLTGFETLARLRQGHPHLPVVVTTGFLDPATRDLLAGIRQVRVLMKPYRLDALKEVLAESLHDQ
jgi:signal transduction histidine kinase/CheY-like chemotaxis protein